MKTAGKITDFEAEFRRKDGFLFWGSLSATQVTDKDGDFIFIDGVVQDITERKRAEEGLRQSYSEIEQLKNQLEAEIPKRTMQMLQSYPWPGNVRELEHAVEGAIISAQGKKLNFELSKVADPAFSDFKTFEEMG